MPPSSKLLRLRPQLFVVLATSAAGGAAYRYSRDEHAEALNPYNFTSFILESRERVSSTSSIFNLKNGTLQNHDASRDVSTRAIWSVELKQPQLQIARAYTPLPPPIDEAQDGDTMRLLIRREKGGEVSNYLHRLPEASTIEVRGPHVECEIPDNTKEVIFLAGGTGIVPAMQLARILRAKPESRMTILWANRRKEDCEGADTHTVNSSASSAPLLSWSRWFGHDASPSTMSIQEPATHNAIVRELELLRSTQTESSRHQCRIEYFVDEEDKFIMPANIKRLVQDSQSSDDARGSKLIFVAGPDGFIEHWAGKKIWKDGQEVQGPLRGALSRIDMTGWSVWKL